jgi:hypothetical protein
MVNLKKIGAIATGALFIGATFGTAAAQFQSSMLVSSGGVVKAKMVTGTANPDASGLAADAASAGIINDAVGARFTVTGGGANVEFGYDEQDLDDFDATNVSFVGEPAGRRPGDDFEETETEDVVWDERWIVTDF